MDLLMALMLMLNLILESLSNCALKKIELYGCTMDMIIPPSSRSLVPLPCKQKCSSLHDFILKDLHSRSVMEKLTHS